MDESWMSARFTKTLPSLSVPAELHAKTKSYADDHDMKLAEVMRKALVFYFTFESTISLPVLTESGTKTTKKKAKKAKAS